MQCRLLSLLALSLALVQDAQARHLFSRHMVLESGDDSTEQDQLDNSFIAENSRGNKDEHAGEEEAWVAFVSSTPIDGDAHIPSIFQNTQDNTPSTDSTAVAERPGSLRKPAGNSVQQLETNKRHSHTHHQDPWGGASWTPSGGSSSSTGSSSSVPGWGGSSSSTGGASWTPSSNTPAPYSGGSSSSSSTNGMSVPLTGKEGQTMPNEGGAFTKALVLIQNSRRTAAGLSALQWDQSLADNMLSYLKSGPNCGAGLQHSDLGTLRRLVGGRFKNVGENLWKGTYEPNAQLVSDDFYNELYCYQYGRIDGSASSCNRYCSAKCRQMSPRAGCQVFHFTQYMWDSITHVGCASYLCPGSTTRLVGCQFGNINGGSGGNMMGSYPFSPAVAQRLGLRGQSCN